MNIIIIGQGAMGLLWYYHIEQLLKNESEYSNTELHLISSKRSISINSDLNKEIPSSEHYSFTDQNNIEHHGKINFAQVKNVQTADIILLCLKSFQIASALKEISTLLKKNASIVLAHNGMGTLTKLSKSIIKNHNIYTLLTTHGSFRSAPLRITHTGHGITDIGLISGGIDEEQQLSLTHLLNSALPNVKYHTEIKQKQWLKLAVNCVINPLTAMNNINNGQINNAEFSSITLALLEEVIAVASIKDVKLVLSELTQTIKEVAQKTAINSSSMRCDVLAKRKSEIDYINGYIHHLGLEHNIATPENTKIWQEVKNLELKT